MPAYLNAIQCSPATALRFACDRYSHESSNDVADVISVTGTVAIPPRRAEGHLWITYSRLSAVRLQMSAYWSGCLLNCA